MPVIEKPSVNARQLLIGERMFAIARWHGALQAKFEKDLFGHSLYTIPATVMTVAHD